MDFSKLLQGFFKIDTWIFLKLLNGFFKVVLRFPRPLPNKTKLKFD